jgi:hypothetical protein
MSFNLVDGLDEVKYVHCQSSLCVKTLAATTLANSKEKSTSQNGPSATIVRLGMVSVP